MKTYDECLQTVGFHELGSAPETIVDYVAYKNGVIKHFNTLNSAIAFSHLVERVIKNEDEVKKYWSTLKIFQEMGYELFVTEVKEEVAPDMSTELWNHCWNYAYVRSHSAGYDEVAITVIGVVEFAERAIEINDRSRRVKH